MAKVVKSIKNMEQKVWNELKSEATEHNMTMSEFLKILIEEHKQSEKPRKITRSMFGAHPEMTPFTREDEADFHEL